MAVPDIRPRRSRGWYMYRRYQLRCPSACQVPTVLGLEAAARVVDQHPAVCPDPGRSYPTVIGGRPIVLRPQVYAEQVA